jgi:hypothetical protein
MYGFCAKPRDGMGGVVAMVINLQDTRQEVALEVDDEPVQWCRSRYVKQ